MLLTSAIAVVGTAIVVINIGAAIAIKTAALSQKN